MPTLTPRSWQDPDGIRFAARGRTWIQINRGYAPDYDHLMQEGGLLEQLQAEGYMLRYKEAGLKSARSDSAYRVLQQQPIPFATYPHEWPFSQWQAAAQCVLDVQRAALSHGMSLKRATPYSVQFIDRRPVWTDIAAFTRYSDGMVWGGYDQFVREFLAPLVLMAHGVHEAGRWLLVYPEGIPLSLASSLLPVRTRVNLGITSHIHSQGREFSAARATAERLTAQADSLAETVAGLSWKAEPYTPPPSTDYDAATQQHREQLVRDMLATINPTVTWDMAAAVGAFSRVAAEYSERVVAFSADGSHVEALWADAPDVLPLWMDWRLPSASQGVGNIAARSIVSRADADVLLLLGTTPLLSLEELSDTVLLERVVAYLSHLAPHLIIEYVPPHDPLWIAQLPVGSDHPPMLDAEAFEAVFRRLYVLERVEGVKHTERVLYAMRRRDDG